MQTSRCSQLTIDRNLLRVLLGLIGFLILSNVLLIPFASDLESIEGHFGYVIRQIDLNSEVSFATWCSSMLLLLNSLCAYMFARGHWSTNRCVALIMAIMSVGFFLLSIDDFISFHESVESVTAYMFSSNVGQTLKKTLGPLFAISLAIILASLFAVPCMRTMQRENIPFLIGCIVCVFSVALAEFVYRLSGCAEPWCFRLEVLFEEGSELSALLLFLTFQCRELLSLCENKKLKTQVK